MRPSEWLIEQGKLDNEQRQVINNRPDESLIVKGSAGSGKTVLAVYKSVIFGGLPNSSCAVIVFTKALKLMLKYGLDYTKSRMNIKNLNIQSVYGWAWINRGMDLDGEVFAKKDSNDEIYLRTDKEIFLYKKCNFDVRSKYQTIYNNYLSNFDKLTLEQRKSIETEFSKSISIDWADYVSNNLYNRFGRRTRYFELKEQVINLDLNNETIFESLPTAVLFTFKPKIDYIVVDEAQDFSETEIKQFQSDKVKSIIFFGDTVQQLYNSKLSIEQIEKITNFRSIPFVKNYRLPKDIARVAEYIQPAEKDKLLNLCQKGFNNEINPTFYLKECTSKEEQLQFITSMCKPEISGDIGILVPTNKQVEEVVNFFNTKNKYCQYRFNRPLGGYSDNYEDFMYGEFGSQLYNQIDTLNFQSDLPCVLTYHSAKGTQFDTVFIPFANDDFYKTGLKRNEFYVALTRSSNKVYIVYQNKLTMLFKDVPSNYMQKL